MDADAGHLQKFADVPFVIEAPAGSGRLASAAAKAMSGVGIRFDDSRGLPPEKYRAIVESVRAQIVEDLKPRADWRIEIFDRTVKDVNVAGRRIDRTLGGFKRMLSGGIGQGAFAQPFPVDTQKPKGCLVVGFPAATEIGDILSEPLLGHPVPAQGITNEKFQRVALWHELGHCLLGASEVRADTFAALMSLRHGVYDRDALSTLASWRESVEWTSPNPNEEHFIAASLWEVVARADELSANPRFMKMGIEEIANVAKAISDKFGLSPDGIKEANAVRRALVAAVTRPEHFVKDEHGHRHRASIQEWGAAHADIPEISRMDEVTANLALGARPLKAFTFDMKALRGRLAALVKDGDPTAKAMMASLDRAPPPRPAQQDFASAIPYRFEPGDFARQAIAMTGGARLAAATQAPLAADAPEPAAPGMR